MEISYYGANCLKIDTKKTSLVVDDHLNATTKSIATDKDIVLSTIQSEHKPKHHFLVDGPGEYEVSDILITGVPAKLHVEHAETDKYSVIYRILIGDFRLAVIGNIQPELTEQQLEEIGTIDIMIIPVGGMGYTLDAVAANKIIKEIEPKVAILTHYDDGKTKYPVPQETIENVQKNLSLENLEHLEQFKLKTTDILPDTTRYIVLEPKAK